MDMFAQALQFGTPFKSHYSYLHSTLHNILTEQKKIIEEQFHVEEGQATEHIYLPRIRHEPMIV